jgi:hypothetical protein
VTDQRLKTLVDGVVPGALIGTGGGILVGLLTNATSQIGLFFLAVGALAGVLGGLAWFSSGSLEGSLSQYADDGEFGADDARRNALRLVGLGVGLALGGAVVFVGL